MKYKTDCDRESHSKRNNHTATTTASNNLNVIAYPVGPVIELNNPLSRLVRECDGLLDLLSQEVDCGCVPGEKRIGPEWHALQSFQAVIDYHRETKS